VTWVHRLTSGERQAVLTGGGIAKPSLMTAGRKNGGSVSAVTVDDLALPGGSDPG
jgi:hypothetical protein